MREKEIYECITCGSEKVDHRMVKYFIIPGMVIVPNSYLLCQKHSNLDYYFEDIYDENNKRKEIDHNAVIERAMIKAINKTKVMGKSVEFNMAPRNLDEIKIVCCPHEWISVEDRFPEDGKQVLTYGIKDNHAHDDALPIQTAIYKNYYWEIDHFCESSFVDKVTHWMPLLRPPK